MTAVRIKPDTMAKQSGMIFFILVLGALGMGMFGGTLARVATATFSPSPSNRQNTRIDRLQQAVARTMDDRSLSRREKTARLRSLFAPYLK